MLSIFSFNNHLRIFFFLFTPFVFMYACMYVFKVITYGYEINC